MRLLYDPLIIFILRVYNDCWIYSLGFASVWRASHVCISIICQWVYGYISIICQRVYGYISFRLLYDQLVGGAVAVTWQQFLVLNGYSNQYFGWGGEDDDFYVRITQTKTKIVRYPLSISRYMMVQHYRDSSNPVNDDRWVNFCWMVWVS